MAYTTINKSTDNFNTKLYTGNGGTQAVTGVGFQPDWCWIKNREASESHVLFDVIRGVQKSINSNSNAVEATSANYLTAFGADGFTVGASGLVNDNNNDYVSWNWKAGTSFTNDASVTGIGTIDSTGTVNDAAGFSIVKYTGGSGAGTVKHGLSTKPELILLKPYSYADNWRIYHHKMDSTAPQDYFLKLQSYDARGNSNDVWNDTAPTSSVFSIGSNGGVSGAYNFIAYCFTGKTGYSKFGSYVGNGNGNAPFIYTGFKPTFVLIKNATSGSTEWYMYDSKRGGPSAGIFGNPNKYFLKPNSSDTEGNETFDFYSNGFKPRITNNFLNGSGDTMIFMAFGQSLVGTNNEPCTAR